MCVCVCVCEVCVRGTHSPPAPIHSDSALPLTKNELSPVHLNFCNREVRV